MTPDEQDLRRALEARSGELSPQFHARLSTALDEGRPSPRLMPAIAAVVAVALTVGTVGVLMMSRAARVSYGGPGNGTRYTVSTTLMAARGGPVRACYFMHLVLPPTGCGGVDVTNVDIASVSGVVTYPNGTVATPSVRLVGTWDGRVLRLSEPPHATSVAGTQPKPVAQAPPPPSGKTNQQVLAEIKRDAADLQQRGIALLSWGEGIDGVEVTLAVADPKSVLYLYDHYGRMRIFGWVQPVDAATTLPSPSATPTIYGPTTAQISAPSRDVVWVLVASTLLFRSTNRGDTWEARSVPPITPGGFQEISFIDAQQGWYLTGPVIETQCKGAATQIWHTNDGAATWQQVTVEMWTVSYTSDNAAADPQCKQGLSFVDPLHGFIVGWATGRHPTIYRTLDGGKNWAGADLPDPPDFWMGIESSLRAGPVKRFGDTLYVEARSGQGRQYVFRSTDSGATWAYLAAAIDAGANYPTLVTASRWLIIYNNGGGQETTDAGQSWHSFSSDYSDAAGVPSTFVFADGEVGYGTVRGGIERTVDGGSHWIRIKTPGVYQP